MMMLLFQLRQPMIHLGSPTAYDASCSMIHLAYLFMKTHLLALLQDN